MEKYKHPLIWFAPIIVLVISFLPVSSGFYTLLRLIITVAAACLVYFEYEQCGKVTGYFIVFVAIALLFNPIVRVHFYRHQWQMINTLIISVFLFHYFIRNPKKR